MKIFSPLYDRVLRWSAHRHAPRYLGALSFAEATFFPIPPDVMLAPMALASPSRAWRFALITTLASVVGGLVGWFIGALAIEALLPWLESVGYADEFNHATELFVDWGFWFILVAGFTPVPFKIFTIAAGAFGLNLPVFVLGSLISRGARFYLVAAVMRSGGETGPERLRRWVDAIGWIVVALFAVVLVYYYGFSR